MEELWYEDFGVLFKNLDQFIPKKEFNNLQKVNSLGRLAMYYTIIVIYFKLDSKWLLISVLILMQSINMSKKINKVEKKIEVKEEKEENIEKKEDEEKNEKKEDEVSDEEKDVKKVEKFSESKNDDCQKPTSDNPLMNMIPYTDLKRKEACKISKTISEEITDKIFNDDDGTIKKFKKKFQIKYDEGVLDKKGINPTDQFNKKVNERQFFTMPVSKSHNDLKKFAEDLYGDIGKCKSGRFIKSNVYNNNKLNRFKLDYSNSENNEIKKIEEDKDKRVKEANKSCTKNISSMRPVNYNKNY